MPVAAMGPRQARCFAAAIWQHLAMQGGSDGFSKFLDVLDFSRHGNLHVRDFSRNLHVTMGPHSWLSWFTSAITIGPYARFFGHNSSTPGGLEINKHSKHSLGAPFCSWMDISVS